jgi:predicted carbohydrate-binding protein with CBM5 and CBM33 domain
VSRAAACDPQSGRGAQSAACRAAAAVRGGQAFSDWDNLRVANVRGRDRQTIPDGKLCSGGIDSFAGLDLPRGDWPSTRLTGGRAFTLTYRSTIPHKGTFKLYLTKDGYDPSRPLRWSDLDTRPFVTAVDPSLQGGAYRIKGTLPADRTGRHVLYTIWQNTDTPDTYYSCSDVVLTGSAAAPGTGSEGAQEPEESEESQDPGGTGTSKAPVVPAPSEGDDSQEAPAEAPTSAPPEGSPGLSDPVPAGSSGSTESDVLPLAAATGALVLAAAAAIAAATLRRRRS